MGGSPLYAKRRDMKKFEEMINNQSKQIGHALQHIVERMDMLASVYLEQKKAIEDIQQSIADLYLTGAESNNENEEE